MKTNRYIGIVVGLLALLSACSESLEDTYDEWTGEGELRYLGKCTSLMASPGWERIIVSWKNSIDPAIQKVKVSWLLDDSRDSVLLERGTTEYSIGYLNGQPLGDGNYEISVSAIDANGNCSIATTTFARPYTYLHEEIMAFNRLVSRYFIIKNRLVLFFSEWQDNMKEASLSYFKADNTADTLKLSKEFFDEIQKKNGGLFYLLDEPINPDSSIVVNRRAELPSCEDEIKFPSYTFDNVKTYDVDFVQLIKGQFGYEEIPEIWADTVKTMYIDYSISSFVSLLNLPKLDKLVLGGRRYLLPEIVMNTEYGQSKVTEKAAANFVLNVLHNLNGLTVERYNKHFSELLPMDFFQEKGMPREPDVDWIDLSGLKFGQYPESNIASGIERLTDNNFTTYWDPEPVAEYTTYQLTLDLKKPQIVHGVRFVQRKFENPDEFVFAPEYVKIEVSDYGAIWKAATYVENNVVGKSSGETTYILLSDEVQSSKWQYVRVSVNVLLYGSFYRTSVAEISLY